MEKFKMGDQVRLKSDGPVMTVEGLCSKFKLPFIYCMWFYNGELKRDRFLPETLKLYDPQSR